MVGVQKITRDKKNTKTELVTKSTILLKLSKHGDKEYEQQYFSANKKGGSKICQIKKLNQLYEIYFTKSRSRNLLDKI